MSTLHIDQLSDFYVRDLSRLTPGTKIAFLHIPDIKPGEWALVDWEQFAYVEFVTVEKVEEKSWNEISHGNNEGDWATEKKPVIFYRSAGGNIQYRYATDAGVIPYALNGEGDSGYNSVNSTVILTDLADSGYSIDESLSTEFLAALEEFNANVVQSHGENCR